MSWQTELKGFLTTAATLAAGRIYPVDAPPKAARPYVVYSKIFGELHNHLEGSSGQHQYRLQLDFHGETYAQATQLQAQVEAALAGWTARSTILLGQNPEEKDDETKLYKTSSDVSLWFET